MSVGTRVHKMSAGAVAFGLGALLLSSCATAGAQKPSAVSRGGTVTVGLAFAPQALDPTTAASSVTLSVFANMCLGLYGLSTTDAVVPVLASQMPTVSDNGLVYTIRLRKGLLFNDGTPFNAAAVKTSLERDKTLPTSARAALLKPVESIKVLNASTVQLDLSEPYAPLLNLLAAPWGIVMSPAALAKEGIHFSQDPICVGPFAFQSRPSLDEVILTRSKYFNGAAAGVPAEVAGSPKIQTLIFEAVTDPSTCYSDLLAGAITVAGPGCLAPNDYALLTKSGTFGTEQLVSDGWQGIEINVSNGAGWLKPATTADNPLATHPGLREALALAINRNTINKVVYDGSQAVNCVPIAKASIYYTRVACPSQNVAEARRLVAASGVHTPIDLTLMVDTGSVNVEQGEVIATEAKAVGFNISVVPTEATTALATAMAGNFQMVDDGWSGEVDPALNTTLFYTQGSAFDYTGEGPAAMMQLLAAGSRASSLAARKRLYYEAEEEMLSYNAIIYLFNTTNQIGFSKKLVGMTFTPDGLLRFGSAGLAAS